VFALVDQYAQLVLDALRYVQPVERGGGKEWSGVEWSGVMWSWCCVPTVRHAAALMAGESDVAVVQF